MPVEMPPENTTEASETSRLAVAWGNLDEQEKRIAGWGIVVSVTMGGVAFGTLTYKESLPDPAVHAEMDRVDAAQASVREDLELLDATYNAIAQKDNPAYVAEIDYDGKPHEPNFPSLDEAADNQHLNEAFQAAKDDPVLGKYIVRVVQASDENEGVQVLVEAQDNLYAQRATTEARQKQLSQEDVEVNFVPPLEAGFGMFAILSASLVVAIRVRRVWLRRQSVKVRAAGEVAHEAYIRAEVDVEDPDFEKKLWAVVENPRGGSIED